MENKASLNKKFTLVFLFVCIQAVTVFGQVVPSNAENGFNSNRTQNYTMGPGDVVDVVVSQNATLTRTGIRINNEGRIQLPMIEEDVVAACSTERELSEVVKEKYKKFLLNPYVIVAVKEFNSNPVAVIGAVSTPGRFQLQRPTKLLELLTLVNGANDKAGNNIELIRSTSLPYCEGSKFVVGNDTGDQLISINLSDTLKGVDEANPFVRAGDIIRVGEYDQVRAYVTGSVRNPSAIDLTEPTTLTQAIAMAGGLASGAQSEKIVIRRQIAGSVNRSELVANLKDIKLGKRDDVLLRPNDLVEVAGPGKVSSFFRTFLPVVTQLPLRVIP